MTFSIINLFRTHTKSCHPFFPGIMCWRALYWVRFFPLMWKVCRYCLSKSESMQQLVSYSTFFADFIQFLTRRSIWLSHFCVNEWLVEKAKCSASQWNQDIFLQSLCTYIVGFYGDTTQCGIYVISMIAQLGLFVCCCFFSWNWLTPVKIFDMLKKDSVIFPFSVTHIVWNLPIITLCHKVNSVTLWRIIKAWCSHVVLQWWYHAEIRHRAINQNLKLRYFQQDCC